MDQYAAFYTRAIRFLALRPRTEKEVRDSLAKKDAPPDIAERVIAKLISQKFLDDSKFAKSWIEQRSRFRPRSIRLLKIELKQKGVSNGVIEEALKGSEPDDIKVNDLHTARQIVQKKLLKMQSEEKDVIYQKIGGFLARRGYNWDIIKKSIDLEIEKKTSNKARD